MLLVSSLPVRPLALAAAVEGDLALAAGLVVEDAGEGAFGGAAVGAAADGARGGGGLLFLFVALLIEKLIFN